MTASLRIVGPDPEAAAVAASELLRTITGKEPERHGAGAAAAPRRDLATGIALMSLVLSVPGAILAALDIRDRLTRRDLAARVSR